MTQTVLVTNDDGIQSAGLLRLAQSAVRLGLHVIVAAPATQSSGSSASIMGAGADGHIHMERRELEGLDGVDTYAVSAAPALISLIASHGAFGRIPDLVMSGINHGANVGRAILHSGTVGAALTGGNNGGRAFAVSLDVGMSPAEFHWDPAALLVERLLPALLAEPVGTVFNLNVPNTAETAELRPATLAPFGIVQTTMAEVADHSVRLTVADPADEYDPGTDAELLSDGFATITSLSAVGEVALPTALSV